MVVSDNDTAGGTSMGYAEKRGNYYRARYKAATGQYLTVSDERGRVVKFASRRAAKRAADETEFQLRRAAATPSRSPSRHDSRHSGDQRTFGDYAKRWYLRLDLARATMENYRQHIENHLLPDFADYPLREIDREQIDAWEKRKLADYSPASVRTWHATLYTILADARSEDLILNNPAARRPRRGRRSGRSASQAEQSIIHPRDWP